ncbi:hypothetical protein HETIRDRAFT_421445 [Heterobasidion irregulare TC 32-1]|uniref:Uncharacterized protein n=1 Tax=Heterobasidion irregulare (strain TC 32-1) TaxID=747525 RepID=W4JUV3_HETIT|nr:uncharacterized protein HETIRDRAFT_421445 [Heterobasidion irregulare TC 32-1]ETW77302.1 hypothetical protein HETIRDRAFT_421445 [Heterobasidion irregulare TC 32-1]
MRQAVRVNVQRIAPLATVFIRSFLQPPPPCGINHSSSPIVVPPPHSQTPNTVSRITGHVQRSTPPPGKTVGS